MTAPGKVTEDRGFKELFTSYPQEALEVLVPELIAERGRPIKVVPVHQEWPLPDLSDPSRFLDVALLCSWTDGDPDVLVLMEHWSDIRKIARRRVLYYYGALGVKFVETEIFPLILVTDPDQREVPGRLESVIAGRRILDFHIKVVCFGPSDLPYLRTLQFQSRVAAVFLALAIEGTVDAAVEAMVAMARSPGPLDDIHRFLPLVLKLARMTDSDEPLFRRRLREVPTMGNVFEDIMTEAQARGRAEGEARGEARGRAEAEAKIAQASIDTLRKLVARGVMPVNAARADIEELLAAKAIPEALGREALDALG